jgi:hypothetical protein
MQKLIIQDIAKMNDDWYAMCFHGPERSQRAMNVFLARQPKEYAYWMKMDCTARAHESFVWIFSNG